LPGSLPPLDAGHIEKADGTGVVNLTVSSDICDRMAEWSPDGTGLRRLTDSESGNGSWLESPQGAWRPAR
jgi:hypothetical protein